MKHHPDRGGDSEKFKEINAANEVLGDPEKRELYDKYGIEGVKNYGQQNDMGGLSNFFEMFFGGHGKQQQQRKLKPIVEEATISLEDAYNGKMLYIDV